MLQQCNSKRSKEKQDHHDNTQDRYQSGAQGVRQVRRRRLDINRKAGIRGTVGEQLIRWGKFRNGKTVFLFVGGGYHNLISVSQTDR